MRVEIPVAALWVWLVLGVQEPPKELKLLGEKYSVTSATEAISGVALVTWVSKRGQPNELDVAIVWRGRPGWFMEGQGARESGGGTSTSLQETITRGDTSVSFRFVYSTRQLTISDGPPIDLKDANVVLVDDVTDPGKGRRGEAHDSEQADRPRRTHSTFRKIGQDLQVSPVRRRDPEGISPATN